MTGPEYEVVVTLVDADARQLNRTFAAGVSLAPLSIGSQGDWPVSAQGVASVHLWLRFDGQRLYAASASNEAAVYLQELRIGHSWHEVVDRSELRFGQARIMVSYRSARPAASSSPPARVEPRRLTPIERAAALPLPSFFNERLRAEHRPSPVAAEPRHLRSREQPYARVSDEQPYARMSDEQPYARMSDEQPYARMSDATRAAARRSDATRTATRRSSERQPPARWLLLLIPAFMLPLILAFLWLVSSGHRRVEAPPIPPASTTTVALPKPPAAPIAEAPSEQLEQLEQHAPAPPVPFLQEAPVARPLIGKGHAPTLALPSAQPRAFPQKVTDKPVPRIGAEPWTISEEWRAHHERQLHAPNRARAKVVFLGDSITEGWGMTPAYSERFAKYTPLNLGIVGDVTQNVLWRIEHGALDGTNPEVLVLMIGVNNLAGGFSPQDTVAGVRAILTAVRTHLPNTRVLLLGILPARQNPDNPLRLRISEANRLLATLAASAHVSFHDVGAVLLEPDGTISKATLRDFVHPTSAGYARLSEAVAPLIDALRPPTGPTSSESPTHPQ